MHISFIDLDLNQLSLEAADLVMDFPGSVNQYCECVRKLSKFICVQMSHELVKNVAEDENVTDDHHSSESDCEF